VKKACAICSRLSKDEYIIPSNESKLRIFMANNTSVHAKWCDYLERNLTKFKPSTKLYLCSLHFTDDDFKKNDGKLKPDAMPRVRIGLSAYAIPGPNFDIAEPPPIEILDDPDPHEEQVFNVVAPVVNGEFTIPVSNGDFLCTVANEDFSIPVVNGEFTIDETDLSGIEHLVSALEDPLEEQLTALLDEEPDEPEQIEEKCVICANFDNFDVNHEKEVTYFSFPTSKAAQLAWKESITRHKPGLDFDAAKAWVCSLHFPPNAQVNGAKHSAVPLVVFHQPRVVSPPRVERPKRKPRTGPECIICLGLQHYFPASTDGETNDRPRVFVSFPTNKTMRTLWTKIILTKFPATKIMTPQICTRHFLDTDFDAAGQLVWHATPVIPILPPAPEEPTKIEDDDVSDWMPPDLIEFETVQLTPENAEISSLNAGVDAKEGLATCTFLFTKPSVLVRVTGRSAIAASHDDLQIMQEFEKFVSEAELEYLTRLNVSRGREGVE
jgi:THAP domain